MPLSVLDPGGSVAAALARLGWIVIALMLLTTAVMGVLVLVAALRRRGRLTEHAPYDEGGGTGWILIGGALVPAIVLTALYVLTLSALRTIPADADADVHVDVLARQWWWDITYRDSAGATLFHTANELHVPVGQTVRVALRSLDVNHSFWVPRLHGKIDAIPGRTNTIILRATEPGVYEGECAEYCGEQHALMRLLVVAQPLDAYIAWTSAQARPAQEPMAGLLREGYRAFMNSPCVSCHAIAGTPARSRLGPDLTHFASRRTLAAASFANNRANLRGWIVNAQSMKPGALMPPMPIFDGPTLNAVAAYLESLR